jgi:iron complex transport system substrate-binding protein
MVWIKISQSFLLVQIFLVAVTAQGRAVKDTTGITVQLPDSPRRIVTLTPALGELVSSFLGDRFDRLVGVSEYTDYPPALQKKYSIGPYHQFNLERVVAIRPDVVFATTDGNSKDQIQHLRELSIPVVVVGTESFAKVEDSMRLVALSLGISQQGKEMAKQFSSGMERLREKSKKNPPKEVLLQVGGQPLVVAGRETFLNTGLELLGAQNVFKNLNARYPRPSLEEVFQKDPEVIVIVALGNDLSSYQEMAKYWMQFPSLKAVKTKNVHVIKSDALLRPTLRIFEGLTLLEKTIYGKK